MSVNLSPVAGAAAQFLDNSGNVLTGGKLYTYLAGTTTPAATYTSAAGATFHSNPIILDAAGRVPAGGEIWLSDNIQYKFVLKDANDVLIATWDNLTGINSNFVNYTSQEEIIVATAGQTVFNLTTVTYVPGTNSLQVFVDGVNQYDGITYAYIETDATTVTFTAGLHVGALVKFTTAVSVSAGSTTADLVIYNEGDIGAVDRSVESKLQESVSVKDFGAVGDGVADDTLAIQAAIDSGVGQVIFPDGEYKVTDTIDVPGNIYLVGQNYNLLKSQIVYTNASSANYVFSVTGSYNGIQGLYITTTNPNIGAIYRQDCSNSKDANLVIEGDFRYGWHHKHTSTGGYYNRHEKIFVALGASTYVDSVGIWCEDYYSASEFDSCSVTECVTGMKFDYGNAITLTNPSVENSGTYGIYIGASTIGMSIIAPYFESNPVSNSIHCEAGAQTINVEWARSSQSIVNSITSRNQININGGLTASFQKYGFNNSVKNPQGYLQATTGVPDWTATQATASRETVNAGNSLSAIKVTAAVGASNAKILQRVYRTTTNLYKTFTVSGRYYVPSGQTTDSRLRVLGTTTGYVQGVLFTTQGSWQTFNEVFTLPQPTENIDLEVYAAWNAGGTTVGTEYVLVTDLCVVPGEYFVPNQVIPPYVTYQESALVTTAESDYQQPFEFCGYTAISSGATTVTVTYPTWFAANVTKIISCVATCGSNTAQAIKAAPTASNVVFTVPSAPTGSFKIWYSIKAV